MNLIELIDRYQVELKKSSDSVNYGIFYIELLALPSFSYTAKDMVEETRQALEKGITNIHTRYRIASYAMRRAAMDSIVEIEERKTIWDLMEFEGSQNALRKQVSKYVKSVGVKHANESLHEMREAYGRIKIDVRSIDKKTIVELIKEARENHMQHLGAEINQLDRIIACAENLKIKK
jgi:hypothetical protein